MKEYAIADTYLRFLQRWQEIFTALFAFSAALALIPLLNRDLEPSEVKAAYILAFSFCSFLGPGAVYAYFQRQRAPFRAVAADEDGIWYRYRGKDQGLVRWQTIAQLQENPFLQHLYLRDADGDLLLSVSFHLQDFDEVHGMVLQHAAMGTLPEQHNFSRSNLYHAAYVVGPLLFHGTGFLSAQEGHPWIGYAAMPLTVIAILYEYFTTACGLQIMQDAVEVRYPHRTIRIPFTAIESLRIHDVIENRNRYPEVRMTAVGIKKPFKFKRLGIDASTLFTLLRTKIANNLEHDGGNTYAQQQ